MFVVFPSAKAREVDNFMAWGEELSDSSEVMNQWTREQLEKGLSKVNRLILKHPLLARKYHKCEEAASGMMAVFYRPTYQKIESYVDTEGPLDRFPKRRDVSNLQYLRSSVLERMPFLVPMARIININGIYVGSDKFGHFTSFGNRYFKKFRTHLRNGHSEEEAVKKVLRYGLLSEQGVVGKMTSQVSSFADYEANYQGFVFMKSLCDSNSSVQLEKSTELTIRGEMPQWQLKGQFDWRQHINPDMDESFNTSTFSNLRWGAIRKNLMNYCELRNSPWVLEKFSYYRSIHRPSYAMELLVEFEKDLSRVTPREEHSLEANCSL